MIRAILLLVCFLCTGCTSALMNVVGQRVKTWDRPSRVVAAYHSPDDQLTLLVEGRLPGEPAERQYVLRVPIARITAPRYDPKDPDACNLYASYTNIPMFSRSRIAFTLPADPGKPISVLESPANWNPKDKWPTPLPVGTHEAVALYSNYDPPFFLYLPEPLPQGCALPFMISPVVHQPYFPLIVFLPVSVAADLAACPLIYAILIIRSFDPDRDDRFRYLPVPKPDM